MDKLERKINRIQSDVNNFKENVKIIMSDVQYIKGMILELVNQIKRINTVTYQSGPPSPLTMPPINFGPEIFKGMKVNEIVDTLKDLPEIIKKLKELNK